MPKLLVALVIVVLLLSPFIQVQAQKDLTLESLRVDIWPEYDHPEALIIYHIFLGLETSLPANLVLRIPTSVGEPYNVAVREPDGILYTVNYTREIQGEWTLIQFTSTSLEIQFEYYDPSLTKAGTQRTYTYQWPGDYAVDSLSIQVQQPIGSTDMKISPSLGNGVLGEGELVYYTALVGAVPSGNTFSVSIQYDKTSNALSAELLAVEPAEPIDENTTGRRSIQDFIPWVLGGIGLLLVGGGAWWYWQTGQVSSQAGKRRKHPRTSPNEVDVDVPEGVYCHKCGKRSIVGDVFCRVCGTRLRKES